VGAIEFAALPLLASNGLAATNEVGAIELDASLLRCATAACFKWITCNK
jgi:hypothetical protein